MLSLDSYYRKKSQYNALRSNVQSIISYLNTSSRYCTDVSINLKDKYIVDNDPTPLVLKTSDLSDDIDENF